MDAVELPTSEELLVRFTGYDYAVFVIALALSGAIGLYNAIKGSPGETLPEMLTGNKELPVWPVGTSLMASFISAAFLLGNATEIYANGTMYFMTVISYFITIPVTAHLYMPIFYNLPIVTAYEYLELRFNRTLRIIAVILYTIQMALYLAVSLYAPALALSKVIGMPLWAAVAVIGIICTIYTSIGGIKAVVFTDTFQCVIMFLAFIVIVAVGFDQVGGFNNAWEITKQGMRVEFNNVKSPLNERHTLWGLAIGGCFTATASYATNQMMVLRYLTVKTVKRAKIVVYLNLPYLCLILLLSCLAGIMVYAKYATCDPLLAKRIDTSDQVLPYFVMDALGHINGVPGVFVAGIFMASLSSVSSGVNALASVFYVDVVAVCKPGISVETGSKIMIGLGVFFGMLSIALVAVAQQLGNVLEATTAINSSIGGPLLGLFTMGMFIPHVNSKGALLGVLSSLAITLWISIGSMTAAVPYPSPPVSMDGCMSLYMNVTNTSTYMPPVKDLRPWPIGDEPLRVYELSYLWQTLLAFLVAFVVGIPVSFLTTPTRPETLNPKLICFFVDILFWYLPERWRRPFRFNVGREYVEPTPSSVPAISNGKLDNDVTVKKDPDLFGPNVSVIHRLTDQLFPTPEFHGIQGLGYQRKRTTDDYFIHL
ncbi:sodium-coupled monocarboxylate transporter 1 [Ixodes scapularis]|uniref:sodium-coupled monocarboxylate transporter 1 n=1 Tax=Ixodes scapularis TaxID=6945 RepID=UPI001AD7D74A|nr:sodium-coupled monocarboxylate transporter 1 [Ixodes scapularis]